MKRSCSRVHQKLIHLKLESIFFHYRYLNNCPKFPKPLRLKKRRPRRVDEQQHTIPPSDPSLFYRIAEIITGNNTSTSINQAFQQSSMADDPHHRYLLRLTRPKSLSPDSSSFLDPSVQRITDIVMADNAAISTEEQSCSVSFHPPATEKALNSCLKKTPAIATTRYFESGSAEKLLNKMVEFSPVTPVITPIIKVRRILYQSCSDGILSCENMESVVNNLCRCGIVAEPIYLVNIMKKKYVPDGNVINSYFNKNAISKALHTFYTTVMDDTKYHLPSSLSTTLIQQRIRHLPQELNFEKPKPEKKPEEYTSSGHGCREEEIHQICSLLSSHKKWSAVEKALNNIHIEFTPSLVLGVLHSFRAGSDGAVLRFFSWVGKLHRASLSSDAYNMAMKIAGRVKNFTLMKKLFIQMNQEEQISITADTWSILIMQYGRSGRLKTAIETMKEMKSTGITPSRSSYKCLITCICEKKGEIKLAQELFKQMTDLKFFPGRKLVSTYMQYLCNCGKLKTAKSLEIELKKLGFSATVASSVHIRALCKSGRIDTAMAEAGAAEKGVREYVNGSMVDGLVKKGRVQEAMEVARKGGWEIHGCVSLMGWFFRKGEVGRAMEVWEKMEKKTVVAYTVLVRGYVMNGMVKEGWEIWRRMKKTGPKPDFKAYSNFISCLCWVGDAVGAGGILDEMLGDGIVPSCVNFRVVFHGFNREGKYDLARKLLVFKRCVKFRRRF